MPMPARLEALVADLREAPGELRLELLVEHAGRLRPLPPHLDDDALEPVPECQTPLALRAEVDARGVHVHVRCPPEAPTTRAFASVLAEGVDGAAPDEVAAVPDDLYEHMGLADTVTPLRLRGMAAIVRRLKRQVAEAVH